MKHILTLYICFLLYLNHSLVMGDDLSDEEKNAWFNDDSEEKILAVNEGTPVFLTTPVDKTVLHSANTLTIREESLFTGWVKLKQCYYNMDSIGKAEVVYQYKQMKNLAITSYKNIAKAQVDRQSIQLEDISENASLCVKAYVKIFYLNPDKTYTLVNGPFHRKFLDGYYPYYITLDIIFPGHLLKFKKTTPKEQKGFKLTHSKNKINVKAWFEGKLKTKIQFSLVNS